MALLATVALLLLSLFSGLISAAPAPERGADEAEVSDAPGSGAPGADLEPGESIAQPDEDESQAGAPEEGAGEEAPEASDGDEGAVIAEGEEAGEQPGAAEGETSEEQPGAVTESGGVVSEALPGKDLGGVEPGGGATGGGEAPVTGVEPDATGEVPLAVGGGPQPPEVSPLNALSPVTPETVDPWQSGNAKYECEEAGCECPYAYKIDDWSEGGMDGTYVTPEGNTITISDSDGYYFGWSSAWPVCCVIVKGGITSSDVAVKGLGLRMARALGQVLPGVPVIRTGAECKWPDIPFVIFPGNVGDEDGLVRVYETLSV